MGKLLKIHKTLGNNKTRAWESLLTKPGLGKVFWHKKRGCARILTQPLYYFKISVFINILILFPKNHIQLYLTSNKYLANNFPTKLYYQALILLPSHNMV